MSKGNKKMTEELKENKEETQANAQAEVAEVAKAPTESVTLAVNKPKSPEAIKEAHKELQGKKAHSKKKVNLLNKSEALAELKRLKKAGHERSKYYNDIEAHAQKIA
jgi:hypothetical protein